MQQLDPKLFKKDLDGKTTGLFFLENNKGMQAAITNYGARIVALVTNDREKKPVDVVIGFDSIEGYLQAKEKYYGAIVGRYANRIARGKFSLNGHHYQLAINNPPNHLHGGPSGFHNQVWEVKNISDSSIELYYFSKDGEENYPGNLEISLNYILTDNNELEIKYRASTDAPTIINLTSHPFFNLNGQGSGTINDHQLQINASHYNPVDENLIPTGIDPVFNTPFDFQQTRNIGEKINEDHPQLKYGAGYDHNFVCNGIGFRRVARVMSDKSGIVMEVYTDQPGMQLYTGNHLKGEHQIKYGLRDTKRSAFCLETQHFPDAPNHPDFLSTRLDPEKPYSTKTVYRFLNLID